MHDLPTGTVTFLFTDIEGSTLLLRRLGEQYATVLEEHQRILRAAFEEAGGHEIDTQGDAFFVAFRRAKDAVVAALLAQSRLAAHEWPAGEKVRVRMGLHTAEPIVGDERYVGLGVHRTARICAAGHGGQVLLSGTTRELVADDLPDGASLHDLGHHRLKDIERPEHIFQLVGDGLPDSFPELKTVEAQPDEATPFERGQGTVAVPGGIEVGESRRRGRLLLLAFGLLAVVGAGLSAFLLVGGGSGEVTVVPNSVAVIDPQTNRVVDDVPVPGDSPGPIGLGEDGLWVLNLNSSTLSNIDPATREVLSTTGLNGTPTNMAAAGKEVWIADSCGSNVNPGLTRYAHGSTEDYEEVDLPSVAGRSEAVSTVGCGLAASGESAWLGLMAPNSVVHVSVNPSEDQPVAHGVIRLPGQPNAIALGAETVWAADYTGGVVRRVDPADRSVAAEVQVGSGPVAIVATSDAVWVANQNDGSVSRIDVQTNSVKKAISVGTLPAALAAGPGAIWVANAGDGTVSRIDPATNTVTSTISLGHRPQGVAVADGLVWVTVRG
ncbi:MAG TPA: adenylate/guanylate cyclase domain-containing protein [Gaiellaceae bacterium]|jgi:YVTN family beta-propeller protein